MRVDEITNDNLIIVGLKGLVMDHEEWFHSIDINLTMFLKLKGARLQMFVDGNVADLYVSLNSLIGTHFYDEGTYYMQNHEHIV